MPTYAFLGDATTASHPPNQFAAKAKDVCLYRRLKVADIIASNATMAAAGYIAANDVIQAIPVQEGFMARHALLRIITAGTASVTATVGIGGGAELIAASAMDAAAKTGYVTIDTDSYDLGHYFAAADTIDITFAAANVATGEFELFVFGKQIVPGVAS